MEERVYFQPNDSMVTESYGALQAGKVAFLRQSDAEYWQKCQLGRIVEEPLNPMSELNKKLDRLIDILGGTLAPATTQPPAPLETATIAHEPTQKRKSSRPKKAVTDGPVED